MTGSSHSSSAGQTPNRLVRESSPYLLQHAYNPVDWYPWGAEALEQARATDRPIFLSIGYSACHWCHVMERESFEDPTIALQMNEGFVNIKVDREERPDLDHIYMDAVVARTGSGGWPMSVFLFPDGRPFFGGTYWPPTSRWGRPGFTEVLTAVQEAWTQRRASLEGEAEALTADVQRAANRSLPPIALKESLIKHAQDRLLAEADPVHGGFGSAPKFLHTMDLRLLLRCAARFQEPRALQAVLLTLDCMARGGLYDQLGGGFARYSTDAEWLAPHFEKMLYDNALLVPVYIEAWQQSGRPELATTARETIEYILREMTSPAGAFYSTQDADSEGVEGKFYTWSLAEVQAVLGDDAPLFCRYYDVTARGNWEHTNILRCRESLAKIAPEYGHTEDSAQDVLSRCRQTLLATRELRIHPGRDEKILTSWNGLMIGALAQAGIALQEPRYLEAATKAVDHLRREFVDTSGRLLHTVRPQAEHIRAFVDDYACLADGLIELYQAQGRASDLAWAIALVDEMTALFADSTGAGFYFTAHDHEQLVTRPRELHDNATPAGNNVALTVLLKLSRLTGRPDLEDRALAGLTAASGLMERAPQAMCQGLLAVDFWLGETPELVWKRGTGSEATVQLEQRLARQFFPRRLLLWNPPDVAGSADVIELLAGKVAVGGEPTLYVCRQGVCQSPLVGAPAINAWLEEQSGPSPSRVQGLTT